MFNPNGDVPFRIGFNRNIVECKFVWFLLPDHASSDLIETQWNVNKVIPSVLNPGTADLIETQWNVNTEWIAQNSLCSHGFNRNIVECKFALQQLLHHHQPDLIETQWNVNKIVVALVKALPRFNRNIVECKYTKIQRQLEQEQRFNRNIVECKYIHITHTFRLPYDLIETQWNVNVFGRGSKKQF